MLDVLSGLRSFVKPLRHNTTPLPTGWIKDGMFLDHSRTECWLYRVMPQRSLHDEDMPALQEYAKTLEGMLIGLGMLSRGAMKGTFGTGAHYREFHWLQIEWPDMCRVNDDAPEGLKEWLQPHFDLFTYQRSLFVVGVRLRRNRPPTQGKTVVETAEDLVARASGGEPNWNVWAADAAVVRNIVKGRAPTMEESQRIMAWWQKGRGTGAVQAHPDGRAISSDWRTGGIEFSALFGTSELQMHPYAPWAMEAFAHTDTCLGLSIKGELYPSGVARNLARKSRRKAKFRITEQEETGDFDREEDYELAETSQTLEAFFATKGEPLVRHSSILFARQCGDVDEDYDQTFYDLLQARYGLDIKVAELRQMEALQECMPCGRTLFRHTKPFAQDYTIGIISESGIGAYPRIGDTPGVGVWIGLAPPQCPPVWLDPKGAGEADKPPGMAVLGEPGAGKTFLMQVIAAQAALLGMTVIYINPKPADSLDGLVNTVGGQVIKLSALVRDPGELDPFRFAPPQIAAEIAIGHILCVLCDIPERDEVMLGAGIKAAAERGARCVGDALQHSYISDETRDLIMAQCQGSSDFHLGISFHPRPPMGLASESGLTLIEFDRPLPLPPKAAPTRTYERHVRNAVAVLRLVARASLELMYQEGVNSQNAPGGGSEGGVLIVDEAHTFMASEESRSILDRIGREGRSQRILPILGTQRIADVMGDDASMGAYISRTLTMRMTDDREARAACELMSLEATPERLEWLAQAGPIRGDTPQTSRPAMSLHRDLHGRVSRVLHGPFTAEQHNLFSTNPLDRAV